MKRFKIFSLALIATTVANAQDLEQAKKAIDAEQFEKAKSLLKSVIQAKPGNGRAAFLLGNIYLKQNIADSATIYFQKGLTGTEGAKLNNIGLGQMDLDANNKAAAKAKFDLATKDLKKKDTEEYVAVARAYMNADKPDYAAAIAVLTKAATANPTDAQVQLALGDAYYGDKKQNEAYVAYRNAYQADSSLLRAKMQLGVLLKGAKAYTEAVKAYNEVIAINPNYGPVYRELAETYYLWGNNVPTTYNENIQKALGFYEKYMSLTDYSVTSRMRHADFLILAKDYKALEVEANKMKEIDGVNPRILRYLGYSAYENGNADAALEALQKFTSNPTNKIIPRDYLYLGQAKIKKGISVDGKTVDATLLASAVEDIKKAVEMEPLAANELNELGKKLYDQKLFGAAAAVFEIAVTVPTSKNYLIDNFYLGNAIYYDNTRKDVVKADPIALQKADTAFGNVITASPTTADAYLFRARTNRLAENDEAMANNYQLYVDTVTAKGEAEVTKNKAKFIEAYNNMAAHYANTDKAKAKEMFNKTLALDPTNSYAMESLKLLK
ncbi:tetratricopeptide repeat protein [Flavobacterium sedimenticola]|uniref:Tetratricopeptide repeat protein n=1 Tax=Flavobacterium sedimenticola TaxID=3043286 RepID=A0ABT6XNE7_9FLAO|nr:tetratricopeptide repeat protein [Flavobacterium sedimenticola]MDI9256615.1 tetratricopeptide repeat protein [Flavobacterium sedimenticola]